MLKPSAQNMAAESRPPDWYSIKIIFIIEKVDLLAKNQNYFCINISFFNWNRPKID